LRKIAAKWRTVTERNSFETRQGDKTIQDPLEKSRVISLVRISRRRQSNSTNPNALRSEAGFLLAETKKASDQERSARKQNDGEANLRRNQTSAKSMLTTAPGHGTSAIFQAANEI
jgi:hypothetical protein